MKKRYQIEQQRAVQQFRRIAPEQNPNIQMILPLADIVGLLQQGVGNLLRETPRSPTCWLRDRRSPSDEEQWRLIRCRFGH